MINNWSDRIKSKRRANVLFDGDIFFGGDLSVNLCVVTLKIFSRSSDTQQKHLQTEASISHGCRLQRLHMNVANAGEKAWGRVGRHCPARRR